MNTRNRPRRGMLLLCCGLAFLAPACAGPLQPLALSPHGHGGPSQRSGPTAVTPLWRANAISAPVRQGSCRSGSASQSLLCGVPTARPDPYARALAEAHGEESDRGTMAEAGGGV